MAKTNWAQFGFNAGELSPRLEMRDDVELRAFGVELMENWLPLLQGPIRTVHGLEYTAEVPASYGRLFDFYISTFSGFIVLATPDTVYVSDQNGFLDKGDLVTNGDFLDGGDDWSIIDDGNGSVVFVGGGCTLDPGNNNNANVGIWQEVPVIVAEDHSLFIQMTYGTGPMIVSVGSTEGGDDIYPATTHLGDSTVRIDGLAAPGATMFVEVLVEGGEATKQIDRVALFNTDTGVPDQIQFPSPWTTDSDIYGIQAVMAPGTLDLYMTSGTIEPQVLSYNTLTRNWTFGPKVFTHPPTEWAGSNWPRAIGFFQGRLYVGGTPQEPERFWASRPGENTIATEAGDNWEKYTDFRTTGVDGGDQADPDAVFPDHAIDFTIDKRGQIRWIMAQKNLVMGTENSEWIFTAQDGVLYPGDIQATMQSTYGSAISQAIAVGNELMYIVPDRSKIRSMGYEYDREQWVSKDLTFYADHISQGGNYFTELHYSANPFSIIFATTNLGTLVGAVYDAESRQAGFFRRVTEGDVLSATTLAYSGRDEAWALVERTEGVLNLEKTVSFNTYKLDSYVVLHNDTPTYNWSAPHLANRLCQAVVEGAVHPDIEVEPDGSFTTQYEVSDVAIGLPIISTMRTLSLGTSIQYVGTGRPSKKRFNTLYARITASRQPSINGRRAPVRTAATPMGETEPAKTETVQVSNLGWDLDGKITIVQDLPVYTELAGLFGQLNQDNI